MRSEDAAVPRWTLKREVSIGDLIAFGAAALSVAYAYTTLDKRLALVEQAQTNDKVAQTAKDKAQDDEHHRSLSRIEATLAEIRVDLRKLTMEKRP